MAAAGQGRGGDNAARAEARPPRPRSRRRGRPPRPRASASRRRRCVVLPLVEDLYRDGVCVLRDGITPAQVTMAEEAVEGGYRRYMHAVKTLDLQEKLQDQGFYEIKMRNAGRYDLQLPELSTPPFSFLTHDAPWMPLVHAALGGDAVLCHFGCMLSFPGSAVQPWHADGPHIRGCGEEGYEPFGAAAARPAPVRAAAAAAAAQRAGGGAPAAAHLRLRARRWRFRPVHRARPRRQRLRPARRSHQREGADGVRAGVARRL